MSDLRINEKKKLEELFQMRTGDVLDFSHRTLAEFIMESVDRNIHDAKYSNAGSSKANFLRTFWTKEPNHIVGKLLKDLLEYCHDRKNDSEANRLFEECERIAERLLRSSPVDALEAIAPEGTEREFEVLVREVHNCIERDKPEAGLDRLHTYVTKLIRILSERRGITIDRNKPLHSIFGEYVKALRGAGLIESEMTELILKSSISTMEAFNRIRNDRTFAHDNPTLNHDESLFIFNSVCNFVRFIRDLEARAQQRHSKVLSKETIDDRIPF